MTQQWQRQWQSDELYIIDRLSSAGRTPQEQDEEQGLLISIERMVIIVVIVGLSCPPKQILINP